MYVMGFSANVPASRHTLGRSVLKSTILRKVLLIQLFFSGPHEYDEILGGIISSGLARGMAVLGEETLLYLAVFLFHQDLVSGFPSLRPLLLLR